MKIGTIIHRRISLGITLLASLTVCVGCVAQSAQTARERVGRTRRVMSQSGTTVWVEKIRDYALMSELAYRGTNIVGERWTNQLAFNNALARSGWVEVTDRADPTYTNQNSPGLHFDVWENSTTSPARIAVAFRGTESTDRLDWRANSRWALPLTRKGDQYDQAIEYVFPILEKAIARLGTNVQVVTTGHSLGGGLAQCIFYSSYAQTNPAVRVQLCYAFDSSPVTSALQFGDRTQRKTALVARNLAEAAATAKKPERGSSVGCCDFGIVRIYEHGEILSYPRSILRQAWPLASFITELRFNFRHEGSSIAQHAMAQLALEFMNFPDEPNAANAGQ